MLPLITEPIVEYPDSDGKPMADNTLQFEWIVTIKGNLDLLFANDPKVFVAGDNLIYPVEGKPVICQAPDVYVSFGRPKGYRGSYKVWKEGNIFPQVVFEVLSPNNTSNEMEKKLGWYQRYGAEEYYVLDPDLLQLEGYIRAPTGLVEIPEISGFKSPKLGITFEITDEHVELRYPGGSRFLTFVQLGQLQEETARQAAEDRRHAKREKQRAEQEKQRAEQEKQRAEQEKQRAEQEKQRAEQEKQRAEQEKQRAEQEKQRAESERLMKDAERLRADKLAAKLRELGVDPDA